MVFAFRVVVAFMMSLRTKILVVDAPDECAQLREILSADYDVRCVSSAREALALLGREPFGLVLLGGVDEVQKVLNGLSCSRLRPKVILLTPTWCPEILSLAVKVGADGVLASRDAGEVAASVAAHLRS